jgi:hypothetical protein
MSIFNFVKNILGFDESWKSQFDNETDKGVRKINENFAKRNLFKSGMRMNEIGFYKVKRKQEKKDEERRRLIQGLEMIPPWLAVIISIISLIVSFIALNK